MREKEKMMDGQPYDADDHELVKLRLEAKDRCHYYNRIRPSETEKRRFLLGELLGSVAGDIEVLAPFFCDYGFNITLGQGCFFNHGVVMLDPAPIRFGDDVLVGPGCQFVTATHPQDPALRLQKIEMAKGITVGDNVWFGAHVTVLPGVSIGSRSIIGAGSVVTRDIPEGVVAWGNPCRVQRSVEDE